MTRMSISSKNIVIFILILVYLFFYCIWLFTLNTLSVDDYATLLFPWVIVALFIQIFCFLCIKKVTMFDMGLWFLVLSYLFMYGYLFITSLGLETSLAWQPIKTYKQTVLFQAASFINVSLNMFSLGYLLKYNPDIVVEHKNQKDLCDIKKYKMGILLCTIGGLCQVVTSWRLVAVTQKAGSYTAYSQSASSGITDDIAFLFVPGVIYVLASKKLSKAKALVFTGIVVGCFALIMLLSGSRKTQIFGIVAIAICYLHTYKPPKLKIHHKIFIVLGGVIFLNLIYVIRDNRVNLAQTIPAFIKSFSNLEFISVLLSEVLAETGITFCSVASIVHCVPHVFPFEYGATFLRSIVSILPVGWLLPNFFAKAASTMTINKYMNLPVGGSVFGDFYWNWGNWGIIAAFLFGMILSACFVKLSKKSSEVYFSIFYIVLIGVRSGVFELVRPLFVVLFVPWLLKRVFMERRI